jgi:hypothetical protein
MSQLNPAQRQPDYYTPICPYGSHPITSLQVLWLQLLMISSLSSLHHTPAVCLAHLLRMQKVPDSSLDPNTGCNILRFFVVFLSHSRKMPSYIKSGHDRFHLFFKSKFLLIVPLSYAIQSNLLEALLKNQTKKTNFIRTSCFCHKRIIRFVINAHVFKIWISLTISIKISHETILYPAYGMYHGEISKFVISDFVSSVSRVTGRLGFDPLRKRRIFPLTSVPRPLWGPPSLLYVGYRGSSRG